MRAAGEGFSPKYRAAGEGFSPRYRHAACCRGGFYSKVPSRCVLPGTVLVRGTVTLCAAGDGFWSKVQCCWGGF